MNEEQQERPAVPITRVRVECEISMTNGGNTHIKFLAVLDDDVPMRNLLKTLSEQYNSYYRKSTGFCIIEQAKDESGERLPRVGRVGDTLKHDDLLRLRGRQLLPEVVEDSAISWLFRTPAPPTANHEMTPATCSAIAEALLPTLIPSLIPALVSALVPALKPHGLILTAARTTVRTQSDDNSSSSDSSDNDEDTEAHKEIVRYKATVGRKETGLKEDAAQTAKAHDNALMGLFKSDPLMDEDTDSSDEDEDMSPVKEVPHSNLLIVAQATPVFDNLMPPKVVQIKPMETPAKVMATKPTYANGLDSLVLAQTASSSSTSTSPASSRSPSLAPVRSPAPSPAPVPRRESMSLFTTPAIPSSISPSANITSAVPTRIATSPVMPRMLTSAAKNPSTGSDQSRRLVSSERPMKSKAFAGFAIAVPQDPFRSFSAGIGKEYDESEDDEDEDDITSSQDFLYSAKSRPTPVRAFSPIVKDEGDEEEGMLQDMYRLPAVQVKHEIQNEQFKERVKGEDKVASITTSEPSAQASLVDIKEEPLSQNVATAIAKHQDSVDTLATSLLDRQEEDEDEDGPLSPEISPPGALLEYLNRPASSSLRTIGQIPGSSGPDKVPDSSVDTTEIEAFLQKDMGGLSRDKSLTSAPFFLPRVDPVSAAVKAESLSPGPVSSPALDPGRDFGDESTVSPELRPSASPMVIARTNESHQAVDELKLDSNNHDDEHHHGISDDEDSIFNIPSAQPIVLGSEAMANIPDGPYSQDDTRDAMDELYSSASDFSEDDDEPADSGLKRKTLTSSSGQELKRQRIVSSPSSDDDSDDSDDSDGDGEKASGKGGSLVQPHPLDALDDLPLFSSRSSLPSMPTLTSLSQEHSVKAKKMGSLELALQQQQADDDNDGDDSTAIKRTGPTTVVSRSARGGWSRGGSTSAAARGAGSSGHGRGGVTIAGAGRRAGGVKPSGGLEDLFA
ncbi:hypothetical protein BGX24_011670 [Mortierella sp. AD032]|nr:hypothetical protein BGX24_011670 [Mortierella sp. AD032]